MFNKLISSLPFNPSLITQVSFYANRLKQESSIRRLGFILVALMVTLQMFAVFSPAKPTLANDDNDVVAGGFDTKAEAVAYCQADRQGFRDVLSNFAISCDRLNQNATVTSIRSTDYGNQLYSMGRIAQGPVNQRTGKATNETELQIGGTTFYMRLLSNFDTYNYSTYKVLEVTNVFGVKYFILFSCANIVQVGKPVPPPPIPPPPVPPPPLPTKPCPESKTTTDIASCLVRGKKAENNTQGIFQANNTTAKPGDQITYTLLVFNSGTVPYKGFVMKENMADVLEYADIVSTDGGTMNQQKVVSWAAKDVPARGVLTHTITVKVKDPIPSTPQPCNSEQTTQCPATTSFDLVMTNVYGNTVNIKVPPTIIKTTEIVTTKTPSLPKTGPGTGIAISAGLIVVVSYFYARSRLMAKELDIIRNDHTMGGGSS